MRRMTVTRWSLALGAAISALSCCDTAKGILLDLTGAVSAGVLVGDIGGPALFVRDHSHPTGTGVFDPFLTIQSPGNQRTEQGYNTSSRPLPLDDLRNHWNTDLQFSGLRSVQVNGVGYFVFELDANEPGRGIDTKYMSLDNIRIYTSPIGGQTPSNPDALGILRFALNALGASDNWVKIDSALGPTAGSGDSDLFVYIPQSDFAGVSPTDFVYFYNFNGAHFDTDGGTGVEAGFEEWRALTGQVSVPDSSSSLALLGLGFLAIEGLRRKFASTSSKTR